MNKHQAQQLMDRVRGRVHAFHQSAPAESGFRVSALANSTGGTTTALYIYDTIGGWDGITAKEVVGALAGATGDVVVHINSGGGDMFEGVAIHNALKNYPGKITAHVDGVAASAASFICMAADTIVMEPNSSMMIHDGWGLCVGNAADMRETAELLDMLSDQIADMYALRTGGKAKDWRAKMATDTWYTAKEAVAAGLADEVAAGGAGAPENTLDLSVFNYASQRLSASINTLPKTDDVAGSFAALKEAIK
jgi:ATP-dependent protease ClpP protease subunit